MHVRIIAEGDTRSAQGPPPLARGPASPSLVILAAVCVASFAKFSHAAALPPPPDHEGSELRVLADLAAPDAADAADAADTPDAARAAERARLEAELAESLDLTPPPLPSVGQAPSGAKFLPDISLVGTFAAAWFSDEPTLRFAAHEPLHRGPQLQEIEVALQSNIDPFVRADIFLAISLFGIEVEEAYATTLALPWNLQARGGLMYAPFGRFNQTHFLEVSPFADMPLPNRRFFGGEQLRGVGVEASWLVPLPFFAEVRAAALGADNELSFGIPATDIERVTDLLSVVRLLTSFDFSERLTLNLGASVANGPNATGGTLASDLNRTDVFGGDLYLKLRDPSSRAYTALQAEYLYRRATVPDGRLEQGGAYAWLVRRFDASWEAAIRGDLLGLPDGTIHGSPSLEGGRAPFLEPASQYRVGAAVSFYPSEFQRIRVQANYDFGIETAGVNARGVQEYFLQYQLVMGAHGAHPF